MVGESVSGFPPLSLIESFREASGEDLRNEGAWLRMQIWVCFCDPKVRQVIIVSSRLCPRHP